MFKNKITKLFYISLFSVLFISCSEKYILEKDGEYKITAKNVDWTIAFPTNGFKLSFKKSGDDGSGYYVFYKKSQDIVLSFAINPEYEFTNTKNLCDDAFEQTKARYQNVKNIVKTNYPDYSSVEFLVPNSLGILEDFQNMHTYYLKDGYQIDVHISKPFFKEKDRILFADCLKSFRFDKCEIKKEKSDIKDSITNATMYYLKRGLENIKKDNTDKVLYYYQKVYDNELMIPTLPNSIRNALFVELAIRYGMQNDIDKCKEIMRYGISQDSTYSMFYYTLACSYAETNNLIRCIENLKTAYKYKKYLPEGETIPEPRKDDSFQKYLNDSKFQDALKEIGM